MPTNANRPRPAGVAPQVVPAPGGAWHIYPNGRKVFVKAGGSTAVTAVPGTAGAPGSGPAQFSPDSQYFQWDAAAQAKKQVDLADNDAQGTTNVTARDEALRQLKAQQPVDESAASTGANRSGLFYSTNLGNKLGDIATQYVQRRGQAATQYQQAEDARSRARAAIEAGYGVDQAAQYAASADRQTARDTTAADAGALVGESAPGAPAASSVNPVAAPKVAYTTRVVNGRLLHVYPNRKKPVVVRRVARSR